MSDRLTACLVSRLARASARKRAYMPAETNAETSTERSARGEVRHIAGKDINRRIAAEISWSRTGRPERPHPASAREVPATLRARG